MVGVWIEPVIAQLMTIFAMIVFSLFGLYRLAGRFHARAPRAWSRMSFRSSGK
jgi:hypothetical protein